MPTVSVIIPTYNYGKYIERAIDSVFAQTYQDYEIIVVDDGSTDNTREIIETRYKKKVRYFYQENKGPGAARNLGLRHMRGDFIVFLDSDDYFLPKNIETKISIFNQHPEIDWLFSDIYFVDQNGDQLGIGSDYFKDIYNNEHFQLRNIFMLLLENGNFIHTSTIIIKKSCFEAIGFFDESQLMHQDYFQWLRLSYKYPNYYYIGIPLSAMRRHTTSWGNLTKTSLEQRLRLYLKLEKLYQDELRLFRKLWNKRFADAYNRLAMVEIAEGCRKNAITYLIKSIIKWPYQQFAYLNLFRNLWG